MAVIPPIPTPESASNHGRTPVGQLWCVIRHTPKGATATSLKAGFQFRKYIVGIDGFDFPCLNRPLKNTPNSMQAVYFAFTINALCHSCAAPTRPNLSKIDHPVPLPCKTKLGKSCSDNPIAEHSAQSGQYGARVSTTVVSDRCGRR